MVGSFASLGAVPIALLVDRLWGEPPAFLHPVVVMGRYLRYGGDRLTAQPAMVAFCGGALAWMLGALLTMAAAAGVAWAVHEGPALLGLNLVGSGVVESVLLGLLLKPLLAWRMLRDEVAGVEDALGQSVASGRARLQRLVSRNVDQLDAWAVRESAIESLTENLNDSVVAPLFWFALGGLAGAALYRFANTADAMWGYRGRYEWAGKFAARADDVLSWVPARLTAVLLCLAAGRRIAWAAMRREAGQTPSPNGGWPMGTMALLLQVRLRKPGVYALNAQAPSPRSAQSWQALAWSGRAVLWAAMLTLLISWTKMVWTGARL